MELEILTRSKNRTLQKQIILKIQEEINNNNLQSGDKLPPERIMSEKFGVSRRNLSKAIQKLEFYGLLKSRPQSGTFLANVGKVAMNGMIDDILNLEAPDFKSLIETRITLESKIVELAALRRTKKDLAQIKKALTAFKKKLIKGENHIQEDLLFHLAIAKASKNTTLNNLMLLITPKIIWSYKQDEVCEGDVVLAEIRKHEDIYLAIEEGNPNLARKSMQVHFTTLNKYLNSL